MNVIDKIIKWGKCVIFTINHQPSAPLTLCLRLYQQGRNYCDINPCGLGRKIDWREKQS